MCGLFFFTEIPVKNAKELPHNKTNKMTCVPSEDRSAWASAQSDQSLRCVLKRVQCCPSYLTDSPQNTGVKLSWS